jgi:hypothetical protein
MIYDVIHEEASRLAQQLAREGVDLNEAKKFGDYYRWKKFNEHAVTKYLDTMASNPPARSRQTKRYYIAMRNVWTNWKSQLRGADKCRAFLWAVRLAQIPQELRNDRQDPSVTTTDKPQYKAGQSVQCVLIGRTKGGGWKAKIVGTELSGPVTGGNPPTTVTENQTVSLQIATISADQKSITFRWPLPSTKK